MVRAEVRLCEAGVPGAPDRVRGAAHRRSRADRGASRQDLRYLPAHRSARQDRTAGHHRRYRRKEPGQARPMAVAADPDRGSRHQPDQARRRRDRLRHHLRRARPAQSRRRRRHLPQSRRRNQDQAARAAEQRSGVRRCDAALARGAGRIRTSQVLSGTRQDASGDGAGDAGRGPAALHVQVSGPAAQHAGAGKGGRRARPAHDQSRTRRHRPAGADDHAGAGRDHAVAELRNAAGGDRHRHHLHQVRHRPASRASAVKGFEVPTDRNGQLWVHFARHDPSLYVSGARRARGHASRRKRSRASWC